MAKQDMSKPMSNRECNWVSVRLPLWVDNGECADGPEAHGEGGDLSARERRQIEQHLATCDTCRNHAAALEHALGALAVAANGLPVSVESPSLWPLLETRIANRDANAILRQPKAARALADRSVRPWGDLDETRPLSDAWAEDGIAEAMDGRNKQKPESKRLFGMIVKIGVAATILVALVGITDMLRQSKNPRSATLVNSTPLADPVASPAVVDEPLLEVSKGDPDDVPANQLAEAESARPRGTSRIRTRQRGGAKTGLHNTRFGFDLEHGTPMPRDSREAKPVY